MLASNPATTARPEIIAVSDLLEGVTSGTIRIPRFQRPYVWSPDDMIQLFDSVLRGYP
ncbi:MAG: GmrSD restriction endonuclease domain-containing protein, partial [Janthinobacterium lividum]